MNEVTKQCLPVVCNDKGEPIAVVYLNIHRDRVIYMLKSASEDEICALLGAKQESNG